MENPCFNPFETGQGLSTEAVTANKCRCLSFNPFETGQGLSTIKDNQDILEMVSFNPFETGQGLSTKTLKTKADDFSSFNPFETGQGLSTFLIFQKRYGLIVSIPLRQGRVFRLREGLFFLHFNKLNNGFPRFSRSRRVSC